MVSEHQYAAAKQTVELMFLVGDTGKRLNSKAKVRFANKHGHGDSFVFGDRVIVVNVDCTPLVFKVPKDEGVR